LYQFKFKAAWTAIRFPAERQRQRQGQMVVAGRSLLLLFLEEDWPRSLQAAGTNGQSQRPAKSPANKER